MTDRQRDVQIDESTIQRAGEVADTLDRAHDIREHNAAYDHLAYEGKQTGRPTLHLEDVSGIPFVEEVPGVEEYQHRARVRARTGDLFATVTPPAAGYEDYNREVLGLGEPELVLADPDGDGMAVARACARGKTYRRIREFAEQESGLVIHPYMAIESVWQFAEQLHSDGVEATVIGPPPPVLWIANDKARIAEINDELFDTPCNVTTRVETAPRDMAQALVDFADHYERVGLKRTRCASAMGNLVLESDKIREVGPDVVLRRVQRFLNRTEWPEGEEVLVVEWFESSHSPSTQTWIPPESEGTPRLDGVYEQLLKSEERIFVGSHPSRLPEDVNRSIARASLAVGLVLQKLGYVGRCSFDFVVGGDLDGEWDARMIECNGRWGGTSTPMQFVDRLVGDERPPYVAMDFVHRELVGATFREILEATRGELYDPSTGEGRFVFYNVGPLDKHGKLDVVSFGDDIEDARRGTREILPEMLGLC